MFNIVRHVLLLTLFVFPHNLSSQTKELYVDMGRKISSSDQKMISGVNGVKMQNDKNSILLTYLADNSSPEEIYGKSDSVYVAVQIVNINKKGANNYKIIAQKGMKINKNILTTIPYNPFIGDNNGNNLIIFEGAINYKSRGLLYRNLHIVKKKFEIENDISYLKIRYNDNCYDINVDTYDMILKDKGYVTSKPGCFVVDLNPRKDHKGIWHMAIGCSPDNFILVLKSDDLYSWEYESILPIKGNETDVYYKNSEMYYVTRSMDKIFIGKNNSSPKVIESSIASRPRIFDLEGDIFFMYNIDDYSYSTERSTALICKLDEDSLHREEVLKLQRAETIHYFDVFSFIDKVYVIFSTDATDMLNKIKGELQIIKIPHSTFLN